MPRPGKRLKRPRRTVSVNRSRAGGRGEDSKRAGAISIYSFRDSARRFPRQIFFTTAMIAIAPARVGSNDAFPLRVEYMAARRVHVGEKSVRTSCAGIRVGLVERDTPTWAVNAPRCGTPDSQMAGKRRNAPDGPVCPTRKGRALFAASGVAQVCGVGHRGATRF